MDAVHVVGAGGIGCAVGCALRAAGRTVTFVDVNRSKIVAGRRDGVRVDNRPPLPAEFVHFGDWAPPPNGWVLLCTKCYDTGTVLDRLTVPVQLLPIQNGFDTRLEAYGHVVEGIASFVSDCDGDRPHTRITRRGHLHIGVRKPPSSSRSALPPLPCNRWAKDFAEVSDTCFRLIQVSDISPIKHTKLMYNAAVSPLAAAAGIDNGKLLSVPEARHLFFALLQENYAILRSAGIELGRVGPFHPRTVAWILRRKWLAALMAKFFEPSLRGTYCSMAGEIQRGRTELENYNGHLIRLADRTGVPCPLNRRVYELVEKMTAAQELPRLDVFGILADCDIPAAIRITKSRS
jgi:2-dehydropantoate 2-reductase